jgi:hypothetical protein
MQFIDVAHTLHAPLTDEEIAAEQGAALDV